MALPDHNPLPPEYPGMSETPLPSRVPSARKAPLMNRWMPSLRSVCNVPAGMINSQRVFQTERPIRRLSLIVSA